MGVEQNKLVDLPAIETHTKSAHDLVQRAAKAIDDVRTTLRHILDVLPDKVGGATDLSRALGINTFVAWNVYRAVSAPDALSAGKFVPKPGTIRTFFTAAKAKGVQDSILSDAINAYDRFSEFVKEHTTDRAAFNSLILDFQSSELGKEDLRHKRAAFRAYRHLRGVHSDLMLCSQLYHPSATEHAHDTCFVHGQGGIRRSRSNSTLLSEEWYAVLVGADGSAQPLTEALDPDSVVGQSGMSLLKRFCSHPLPDIRNRLTRLHQLNTQVHTHAPGSIDAATYFFSGIVRNRAIPQHAPGTPAKKSYHYINLSIPTESLVYDMWFHKSFLPESKPWIEQHVQSALTGNVLEHLSDHTMLPHSETVEEIGYGLKDAAIPEFARYQEMISYASERMHWRIEEFKLFRCRIEYPMLSTIMKFVFPFPSSE